MAPDSGGNASLHDHLEQLAKTTGQDVDELIGEQILEGDLPDECIGLWTTFLSIHRDRPSAGFGVGGLTSQVILGWCELHDEKLDPFTVNVIQELDQAFLDVYAKASRKS